MKITYVYSTFATKGGTERIITEKANYLTECFGYDVTFITCFQHENEQNFFRTSNKIKQINLEIPYFSQYKYKYPVRLWVKWKVNRLLRERIKRAVKQEDPDILIGVSRLKANYISAIKCRAIKIIECHVVKFDTLFDTKTKRSFLERFIMKIHEYIYLRTIERNADVIVTLTEQDRLLWKKAKRTEAIANFSTMPISHYSDCTRKRVIAVGRLIQKKGFERLIEIWTIVSSKHPNWLLDIFGEGEMYDKLIMLIQSNNIKSVKIHKATSDISIEYANSSICAVTSYVEGFSLVILEAMKHGVPCIAFDCPFGPSSIIKDEECGFLINDGDIKLFAEKLCNLIENYELRKHLSQESIERAKQFDVDRIMNQWKDLYENLCPQNGSYD